jgi:hypothetical protein
VSEGASVGVGVSAGVSAGVRRVYGTASHPPRGKHAAHARRDGSDTVAHTRSGVQ